MLLPVRNGAAHIGQAIESILSQTYSDFELLVVDDGSDDDTPRILDSLARREPRLRIVPQEPAGLIPTLNRGLADARGELFARQDADDVSEPTRLAEQVAFLQSNPDIAVVGTCVLVFDGEGTSGPAAFPVDHERICDGLLLGNMFAHGSVMFRRNAVLEAGGYRDLPDAHFVEDYDLWIRLARRHRVANLPRLLYRYRSNPHGVSSLKSEEQIRHARKLVEELCRVRGYRDFWRVSGYSMRRWAGRAPASAGRPGADLLDDRLDGRIGAIRLLWRLGERGAALRRLLALLRYRPISLGRQSLGKLRRSVPEPRTFSGRKEDA